MSMRVYDIESGQLRKWKGTVDDTFVVARIFVDSSGPKPSMCGEFVGENGETKTMTLKEIWEKSIIAT
jgi:hypothetical protein